MGKLRINALFIKTSILVYTGSDFWYGPKNKGFYLPIQNENRFLIINFHTKRIIQLVS